MSVLYRADGVPVWMDAPAPWICEDCGQELEPPCVAWQGTRTLLWHPGCAAHLGPQLIADAREAILAAAPEPHWRRRLLNAVRHRLMAEELVA